jgi:hypothetical protein
MIRSVACVSLVVSLGCGLPSVQPPVSQKESNSPSDTSSPINAAGTSTALPPGAKLGTKTAIAIELSAGTALPQTLPEGAGMAFSVDYRFTQRSNDQAIRYFWVIAPATGDPILKDVRLEQRGTLQAFVPGLRPEQGLFETRLEAQHPAAPQRFKVTGAVPLK